MELGVVVGQRGRDIPVSRAKEFISGYTLALDMTARNFQETARKAGTPWTLAKGFDTFTPVANGFLEAHAVSDPQNLGLLLEIDGRVAQEGSTSDMVFSIQELLAYVSSVMTLEPGDLILTGIELLDKGTFDGVFSHILKGHHLELDLYPLVKR